MFINLSTKSKKIIIPIVIILIGIIAMVIMSSNKLEKTLTIEAGNSSLSVEDFLKDKEDLGEFVTDLSSIDMNSPGIYDIKIKVGWRTYKSELEVIDTIAPKGEAVSHEIWSDEVRDPIDFVKNIEDATEVTVSFIETPEFDLPGDHEVLLLLEDTSGNKSELKASLTVVQDTEPPEIIGTENQVVYIGENVAYRRDVEAVDNRDGKIDFEVDSSDVNPRRVGDYNVMYTARDKAGNMTKVQVTFSVREKPEGYLNEEELYKLVDQILDDILTEDMTDKERLWAIFKWTHDHIAYTGSSDKSDWKQGAVQGIRKASGDCFTYYATARVLLTRAGFENIEVTRLDGTHYWSLVLYEDSWYHFDTTRHIYGYPAQRFLRTDEQVEEYSNMYNGYYEFDKSLYPRTPTEALEPLQ